MTLAENLDPVSGAYDAADGGHLYVLDNDPDAVVEINPAFARGLRRHFAL